MRAFFQDNHYAHLTDISKVFRCLQYNELHLLSFTVMQKVLNSYIMILSYILRFVSG